MSINHFSTDLPDTRWWTPPPPPSPLQQTLIMEPSSQSPLISQVYQHHHQLGMSPFNFNLNQNDDESHSDDRDDRLNDDALVENSTNKIATELRDSIYIMTQKEAMFEKPLTPSDVGKLNRLVIPKQHAEKYFPVGGTGNNGVGGGESVEKGVLLSFEDESGISWRFRYSYWNSSQSYVLTKGWSRFVKEKQLDAGDVVMFERQVNDNERFFIGWRRRNAVQQTLGEVAVAAGGGGWAPMVYAANPPPTMLQYTAATAGLGAGAGNMQNQTRGSGKSKTVRLFGVNLECQSDEVDGSSQAQAHYHHHSTPHLQNHPDINFSRDVNQMRFHQG